VSAPSFCTAEQQLKRDLGSLAVQVSNEQHTPGFYLESVKSTMRRPTFQKTTTDSAEQNNQGFLVRVMMSFSRFI
jgi:hypothetical protein